METSIKVRLAIQYGQERIYPVCPIAAHFAALAKAKTFTRHDVEHIKALGFQVVVMHEENML